MKEVMMYEKTETMVESISSDVVTFGFLLLCMWFSYDQGGGWGNYARFLDGATPVTDLELSLSPHGAWAPDQTDSDKDGVGDVCDKTPR